MEHNDDILIDRFLRGELTEDEEKVFRMKLEKDEKFRQQVSEMEEIKSGIRESVFQEKRELLATFENEIENEEPEEKGTPKFNKGESMRGFSARQLKWFVAAAAVLIGVVIFWPEGEVKNQNEKYARLFNEEFETLIMQKTYRSLENEDSLTIKQRYAYRLFAAQLYKEAIPKLEELWEIEKDSMALEYLGWSFWGDGEYEKAEKILENFEKNYEY